MQGFLQGFTQIPPSFRVQLNAAHYTVSTMDYGGWSVPPNGTFLDIGGNNSKRDSGGGGGGSRWSGMLFEILDSAARAHNFTYDVLVARDPTTGSRRADGSWSGILGDVQRGAATIGASPFTITLERMHDFLFVTPVWFDRRALVVSTALDRLNENSTWREYVAKLEFSRVFAPFSWQTWLLVVLATLTVGTLIASMDILLAFFERKFVEHHMPPPPERSETRLTLYEQHEKRRRRREQRQGSDADVDDGRGGGENEKVAALLQPPPATQKTTSAVATGNDVKQADHGLRGKTIHTTGFVDKILAQIELCIRLLTYHDSPFLPVSASAKMLFVAWALTCVIITAIYPANLFSLLTLQPRWQPPFHDLETMLNDDYYLIVERGSSSLSYLEQLQQQLTARGLVGSAQALRKLLDKSEPYFTNSTKMSYDYVRDKGPTELKGKRFALLDWNMDSRDHQDSRCDLQVLMSFDFGSGRLSNAMGSLAVAKGHERLKEALDNTVAAMWQQGIIPKLYREVHTLASWQQNGAGFYPEQCTHYGGGGGGGGGRGGNKHLKLTQVQSIFWLLCSGITLSLVVLFSERFCWTVQNLYNRLVRRLHRTRTAANTTTTTSAGVQLQQRNNNNSPRRKFL